MAKIPKRQYAPAMRSSPVQVASINPFAIPWYPNNPNPQHEPLIDKKEIEKSVKAFERSELIRTLTTHPRDDNVEHLLEEVLMVLKMIHGEEVDKTVSKYRNSLLEKREIALKKQKRREKGRSEAVVIDSSKWIGRGRTDSTGGGGTGPF